MPATRPASRKHPQIASQIADSLYEEFMPLAFENAKGRPAFSKREQDVWNRANRTKFFFAAVVKRISDLLEATGDSNMVWLVCLRAIRSSGASFEAMKHLGPVMFDVVRSRLKVPDGAWAYALWADQCENERARSSAEHWLGRWSEGVDAYDEGMVAEAKKMLDRLVGLSEEIEELTF